MSSRRSIRPVSRSIKSGRPTSRKQALRDGKQEWNFMTLAELSDPRPPPLPFESSTSAHQEPIEHHISPSKKIVSISGLGPGQTPCRLGKYGTGLVTQELEKPKSPTQILENMGIEPIALPTLAAANADRLLALTHSQNCGSLSARPAQQHSDNEHRLTAKDTLMASWSEQRELARPYSSDSSIFITSKRLLIASPPKGQRSLISKRPVANPPSERIGTIESFNSQRVRTSSRDNHITSAGRVVAREGEDLGETQPPVGVAKSQDLIASSSDDDEEEADVALTKTPDQANSGTQILGQETISSPLRPAGIGSRVFGGRPQPMECRDTSGSDGGERFVPLGSQNLGTSTGPPENASTAPSTPMYRLAKNTILPQPPVEADSPGALLECPSMFHPGEDGGLIEMQSDGEDTASTTTGAGLNHSTAFGGSGRIVAIVEPKSTQKKVKFRLTGKKGTLSQGSRNAQSSVVRSQSPETKSSELLKNSNRPPVSPAGSKPPPRQAILQINRLARSGSESLGGSQGPRGLGKRYSSNVPHSPKKLGCEGSVNKQPSFVALHRRRSTMTKKLEQKTDKNLADIQHPFGYYNSAVEEIKDEFFSDVTDSEELHQLQRLVTDLKHTDLCRRFGQFHPLPSLPDNTVKHQYSNKILPEENEKAKTLHAQKLELMRASAGVVHIHQGGNSASREKRLSVADQLKLRTQQKDGSFAQTGNPAEEELQRMMLVAKEEARKRRKTVGGLSSTMDGSETASSIGNRTPAMNDRRGTFDGAKSDRRRGKHRSNPLDVDDSRQQHEEGEGKRIVKYFGFEYELSSNDSGESDAETVGTVGSADGVFDLSPPKSVRRSPSHIPIVSNRNPSRFSSGGVEASPTNKTAVASPSSLTVPALGASRHQAASQLGLARPPSETPSTYSLTSSQVVPGTPATVISPKAAVSTTVQSAPQKRRKDNPFHERYLRLDRIEMSNKQTELEDRVEGYVDHLKAIGMIKT